MLSLYIINQDFNKKLYNIDNRVMDISNNKSCRPFVGILIELGDIKYIAPLSSPKKKHEKMKNNIDFFKLNGGKMGVINFNNMIPVLDKYITKIIPNNMKQSSEDEKKYISLLENQLSWINQENNENKIIKKAKNLRIKYIDNNLPENIEKRCVNFMKLEQFLNENMNIDGGD